MNTPVVNPSQTVVRALQYVTNHKLEVNRAGFVIAEKEGKPYFMTLKVGANRWQENIEDFERDGGVYASAATADGAMDEQQRLYGEVDTAYIKKMFIPILEFQQYFDKHYAKA